MKEILVYADWQDLSTVMPFGSLWTEISKGEETFSFEYTSFIISCNLEK